MLQYINDSIHIFLSDSSHKFPTIINTGESAFFKVFPFLYHQIYIRNGIEKNSNLFFKKKSIFLKK